MSTPPLGLIAGDGRLPVVWAAAMRRRGQPVFAVGVTPAVDPELAHHAADFAAIPFGRWGGVVEALAHAGVRNVVLLGKMKKEALFVTRDFDERCRRLLAGLPSQNDDAVALAFVADLEQTGIMVQKQTESLAEWIPGSGCITGRVPSAREEADIVFGWPIAKAIAGLDVGQTIVVKDRAVLAVEAIDGTDAALRRGGALGHGGAVMIKVSKPKQDPRFDVPTIGRETIAVMQEAGLVALAFEAGRTIIVDRPEVVAAADAAGISIVGCAPDGAAS